MLSAQDTLNKILNDEIVRDEDYLDFKFCTLNDINVIELMNKVNVNKIKEIFLSYTIFKENSFNELLELIKLCTYTF